MRKKLGRSEGKTQPSDFAHRDWRRRFCPLARGNRKAERSLVLLVAEPTPEGKGVVRYITGIAPPVMLQPSADLQLARIQPSVLLPYEPASGIPRFPEEQGCE